MARQLALIQQTERAIQALHHVIEKGFVCASAIESDPCFAGLSSSPGYDELLALARTRRREAHKIFLDAGGPELLSVSLGGEARA